MIKQIEKNLKEQQQILIELSGCVLFLFIFFIICIPKKSFLKAINPEINSDKNIMRVNNKDGDKPVISVINIESILRTKQKLK